MQAISAFVSTAEAGSFTAAAERLGVSKLATSKSVARRENRLGIRLLNHTTRSPGLTAEGQVYYESCLGVWEKLPAAEALLAARRREVSGKLRINLPITFGRLCVRPVLMRVANAHPAPDLDISFTDRRVDLVEEGFDLAVRPGDPGDAANLIGRRIGIPRAVLCAAPACLEQRGVPGSTEDLCQHDCLAFALNGRHLSWPAIDAAGTVRSISIRPRHTVSHGEALHDAAVSGPGIARLSNWLAGEDIQSGRLRALPIETPLEKAQITAFWPKSRDLSPRVRVVAEALAAALRA